jgi:SulP family sulfate permease
MGKMGYIDQSGLYAMEDNLVNLASSGKMVLLVNIQKQPRYMFERIDIIPDLVPYNQIFDDFKSCILWVKNNVEDVV